MKIAKTMDRRTLNRSVPPRSTNVPSARPLTAEPLARGRSRTSVAGGLNRFSLIVSPCRRSGAARLDRLEQADVRRLVAEPLVQCSSPRVVAEDVECDAGKAKASNLFLERAKCAHRVALAPALRPDAD